MHAVKYCCCAAKGRHLLAEESGNLRVAASISMFVAACHLLGMFLGYIVRIPGEGARAAAADCSPAMPAQPHKLRGGLSSKLCKTQAHTCTLQMVLCFVIGRGSPVKMPWQVLTSQGAIAQQRPPPADALACN